MKFQTEAELDAYVYLYDFKRIDLKAIDAVITQATGTIAAWQVQLVREKRQNVLELLAQRKFDVAMEAGQALFEAANGLHNALAMLPSVKRDRSRQVGTQKERKKQFPALQNWIDLQLSIGKKSNDQLWALLPDSDDVDDLSETYFYRDGNAVCYVANGKERSLKRAAFDSRVTRARKEKSYANN